MANPVSWNRAYWVLVLLWPTIVLPLSFLAMTIQDGTIGDFRLSYNEASLPLLTQWYQLLGSAGFYTLISVPVVLALILAPWRSHPFTIAALWLGLVISLYLVFGGIVAAHLVYLKLCA